MANDPDLPIDLLELIYWTEMRELQERFKTDKEFWADRQICPWITSGKRKTRGL